MASITTRQTGTTGTNGVTRKDAPLSNSEIDNNFIAINNAKLESTNVNNNSIPASFTGIGVGTAASSTAGEIRATGSITSFYSDERLKDNIQPIQNALDKVLTLSGVTYTPNSIAESFGFKKENQVGVLAGQVEVVLPEAVKPAPFDIALYEGTEISRSGENYKTVQYEKLVPLLIQAIKELNEQVELLKASK
jgi:hypothetical protein